MRQPDPPAAGPRFTVVIEDDAAGGRRFSIGGADPATGTPIERGYAIAGCGQRDYLDLFAAIARDFGTRLPRNRTFGAPSSFSAPYRPLLTRNLSPGIAYGYGDPAVLHVTPEQAGEARPGYYLVATSNDAPDSFPILWSADLAAWEHLGFAFPQGRKPPWCLDGAGVSDFWAPEMRHVGGQFLLCFTAREAGRALAIGMARSARPDGPFTGDAEPLLRGGVIDAHVFVDTDGSAMLFWKRDSNDLWPGLLAELLDRNNALIAALFASGEDRRTVALLAALWAAAPAGEPMEEFFLLQPLVEAVVARFTEVRAELERRGHIAIVAAMKTAIHAQRLASDGRSLIGAPAIVLTNDLPWEGHLIEGPWLSVFEGRYYLFYAGNDFSTDDYGIGVAVAPSPFGPYRKIAEPLLRSTAEWAGPGHPSLAIDTEGRPTLFFHAFFPGEAAYKAFRALLAVTLAFEDGQVRMIGDTGPS